LGNVERKLSWFPKIDALPSVRSEQFMTPDLAVRFINHQHPDNDENA